MRWAIALPLLIGIGWGTVIDRVAVVVGTQVITESEIDLTVRLTAFLNEKPVDLGKDARRATAARLVDKKIILKELDFSRFPRPTMAEVEPLVESFVKTRFKDDRAAYLAEIEKYGITEAEFKDYRLWLLTFFRFIDFRFRPGVQVSDQEIEDYFNSKIKALAQQANPGKAVTVDEYRDRIERILLVRREDQQLEQWLADQLKRTTVEYRDETLKPAAKAQTPQ